MRLVDAMRLGEAPRLALVGAGGKTRALFCLGRELLSNQERLSGGGTVLLTATTHLANRQIALADRHFVIKDHAGLDSIAGQMPRGLVLLTGPKVEDRRTAGLGGGLLDGVYAIAKGQGLPLLIEADGSRRLPLKAPAGHEPAIPPWVEEVLVVAGLSGLGKPLGPGWVHRPEIFAALSGLAPGAAITKQALIRVLIAPEGGLKNIPKGAYRMVLLNQADDPMRQAAAYSLAKELLPTYNAVIVSALRRHRASLDANDSDDRRPVLARHECAAGIILAAGGSSRFGKPKQLLEWRGLPLVRHVAVSAIGAGLSPLVVVTGYAAEQVRGALSDLPLEFVHNPDWEAGQSASLIAGLQALPQEVGSVIFLLSDQPGVSRTLIQALVEAHGSGRAPIVGTMVDGRRASPVLFDRSTFTDLLGVSGDIGGRAIFSRYPIYWLPWNDSESSLDVDTPEDYQTLLQANG